MPFQDTKDGQTHYYGDGCQPPHPDPEVKESWIDTVLAVIRVFFLFAFIGLLWVLLYKFIPVLEAVTEVDGFNYAIFYYFCMILGMGQMFEIVYKFLYQK